MTKIDWALIETVLRPALERKPEKPGVAGRPLAGTLSNEFDIARENRNNFG
jgi:hypothetical protein